MSEPQSSIEVSILSTASDAPDEPIKKHIRWEVLTEIALLILAVVVLVLSSLSLIRFGYVNEDNEKLDELWSNYTAYRDTIESAIEEIHSEMANMTDTVINEYHELANSVIEEVDDIQDALYKYAEEETADDYEEMKSYLEKLLNAEANARADADLYVYRNATAYATNVNDCYANRTSYKTLYLLNQTANLDTLEEEYHQLLNSTGWDSCPS